MVTDQTPLSSLVILMSRAPSQLPFNVTSAALGAASRNVTLRSGWISGERGIAAAAGVGAGCANASEAERSPATSAPIRRVLRAFIFEPSSGQCVAHDNIAPIDIRTSAP